MIYKKFNIEAIAIERPESEVSVPCGNCAQCCIDLSPILTPDEFISAKYVYTLLSSENPNNPVIAIPRDNNGCYYFKNNKCIIYEDRPKACRQFDCRSGHYLPFRSLVLEKFGVDIGTGVGS